ncbi:MAG: DUF4365 domain-containing protein [Armatimonadetes bacterium]|nr:DUF4365 domain-containing protein [Armatimonadota bacterium]
MTRKRRTREHVIADLSVNFVERQVLLCGYTVEHPRHDYGYDLSLTTYDANGEPEDGEVRIQVKATDTLRLLKGGTTFPWKVARSDLARWIYDPLPVILVVYDARADKACWFYIQRYFQTLPGFNLFAAGKTVTVHVPTANVLDVGAIQQFARFRDAVGNQRRGIRHDL